MPLLLLCEAMAIVVLETWSEEVVMGEEEEFMGEEEWGQEATEKWLFINGMGNSGGDEVTSFGTGESIFIPT